MRICNHTVHSGNPDILVFGARRVCRVFLGVSQESEWWHWREVQCYTIKHFPRVNRSLVTSCRLHSFFPAFSSHSWIIYEQKLWRKNSLDMLSLVPSRCYRQEHMEESCWLSLRAYIIGLVFFVAEGWWWVCVLCFFLINEYCRMNSERQKACNDLANIIWYKYMKKEVHKGITDHLTKYIFCNNMVLAKFEAEKKILLELVYNQRCSV